MKRTEDETTGSGFLAFTPSMTSTLTMPPATGGRRRSSSSRPLEPFPPLGYSPESSRDSLALEEDWSEGKTSGRLPSPHKGNGSIYNERWQPRRDNHLTWANGSVVTGPRPQRKSISDAWKTIRSRKGSASANAQELAEALKAPLSIKLSVSPLHRQNGIH